MKINTTIIFLLTISSIGCRTEKKGVPDLVMNTEKSESNSDSTKIEVIGLNTGKKFRFKGLAIDSLNEIAYLGSWDKKQIVKVSLKNSAHSIVRTQYSGKFNGMGTFLKGSLLYAVMNEVNDNPNIKAVSVLLIIDTNTEKVLSAYEATAKKGRNHFNHVVVDNKGIAYLSNTLQSSIYTVDTKDPKDSLKVLVEDKDLSWVHGIDLSINGEKLFMTSYGGGIKFFDIHAMEFSSFRDTTLSSNDGLKYYKGNLYGVGNNAIKRYKLNEEEDRVIKVDTLIIDHPFFNDPRCLEIQNGFLYCLANIEFEPVEFKHGTGNKRKNALDDTYILKLKLE